MKTETRQLVEQQQQGKTKQKHIRPTVRKTRIAKVAANPSSPTPVPVSGVHSHEEDDEVVEITRQRIESWMGLQGSIADSSPATGIAFKTYPTDLLQGQEASSSSPRGKTLSIPISILKKTPKYSSTMNSVGSDTTTQDIIDSMCVVSKSPEAVDDMANASSDPHLPPTIICKDIIVERDPSLSIRRKVKPFRKPPIIRSMEEQSLSKAFEQHASIEGFIPSKSLLPQQPQQQQYGCNTEPSSLMDDRLDTNNSIIKNNHNETDDPLYIHSLTELMEAAGETLPHESTRITSDTQMVEANLEFSVMTQEEYESKLSTLKQQQEEDREDQMRIFLGKQIIDQDKDDDSDEEMGKEDDDEMIQAFMDPTSLEENEELDDQLHYDSEDDNRPEPEVRAFRLLWQALTNWMTPQTVSWVKSFQNKDRGPESNDAIYDYQSTPMVDRSDVGSSRCAGVMAMLKLYLCGCMEELGYPMEERRTSEKRLTDLLRTFDYSRENPKLRVDHWKAMTCVLVDMVMKERCSSRNNQVPPSASSVGISLEEYHYLTQRSILTFTS